MRLLANKNKKGNHYVEGFFLYIKSINICMLLNITFRIPIENRDKKERSFLLYLFNRVPGERNNNNIIEKSAEDDCHIDNPRESADKLIRT